MGKLVPVIVTREAGTCVDKFWGRKVEGECLNCSQLARIMGNMSHARVLVCHS